jgi:putative ABC transport system substrate-binding protein
MRWLAIGLVSLVGACGSPPVGVNQGLVAPQGRVLYVTAGNLALGQELAALLGPGVPGPQPIEPLAVDVLRARNAAEVTAAIREMGPKVHDYRAIFSPGQTYARAVQLQVSDVPIIFEGVDDPVQRCLVDGLARPGRNATGYMHYLRADDFKSLQLLRDGFPELREVLMLIDNDNVTADSCSASDSYWTRREPEPCTPGERGADAYVERRALARELEAFARQLQLRLRFVVACGPADLQRVVSGAARPAAAWLVPWQGLFESQRQTVVDAIADTRMPAIYPNHRWTKAGGLMSLAVISDTGADRPSVLALLQVLRGRAPATLPVQVPRGFSLTINARTAETFDIRPSLNVLRIADEILH